VTPVPIARTYLPLTPADVAGLVAARELPAGARVGIAVAPGTDEAGEYAAWLAAAALARSEASQGDQSPGQPSAAFAVGGAGSDAVDRDAVGAEGHLRVIASADLDVAVLSPAPGSAPTAVRIEGIVPLRRLVAFHVDEHVGGADADLLWYDVTELDALRALVLTD
jgi:hypothetical protein